MNNRGRCLLALLASLSSTVTFASGQPLSSFGENGTLVVHVDRMAPTGDESAADGLIDRNGRYVTFGSATYKPPGYFDTIEEFVATGGLIVRHLPDGGLDPQFGDDGVMLLESYSYNLRWRKGWELPDGKLLVAGIQSNDAFVNPLASLVCRINEAGTLDTTFALNGCRSLNFLSPDVIAGVSDLAVMDDGRIVVLGAAVGGPTPFAIARLTADGHGDVCFGDPGCDDGGWVYGPEKLADVEVRALAVDESGALIVAGTRELKNEPNDPQHIAETQTTITFRFAPNGTFDESYGIDGISRIDFTPLFPADLVSQTVTDIVEGTDGGIVVIGSLILVKSPEESFVAVAQLEADGALDPDFATQGLGVHRYNDTAVRNWAYAASRQSDGKILIAGSAETATTQAPAVMRMLGTGQPDVQFGDQGATTIPVLSDQFWMYPAAVAVSGNRIAVFGVSAMAVQDGNPSLIVLDRDDLFADAFE